MNKIIKNCYPKNMTIKEINNLIANDEHRTLELKRVQVNLLKGCKHYVHS